MFDWHIALGISSGAIQIYSIIPYIRDTLKGTTRPNIISWFIWFILALIAALGQLAAGASWSVILPAVITFNTGIILLLSIGGYGYKKFNLIDGVCLVGALAAIVIWKITSQPVAAVWLVVIADLISTIPTLIKTHKEPSSETAISWLLMAAAAGLAIISTTKIDTANLLYPTYTVLITTLIGSLAFFGQRKKSLSL